MAWRVPDNVRAHPGLVIVPGILLASVLLGDAVNHGPVLCPFRLATGMPCAGCGLTRAFVALGHGHVHAALDFNLLSPLLFAWMLSWWLLTVTALARQRPIPPMPIWLVRVAFFGLGGYWLARLIHFAAQPDLLQRMAAASPLIRWLIS